MIKLSVVIPARSEFPSIVHTFYSIMHCWEAEGHDPKEIEIIIVDNASDDDKFPQKGTGGTTSYLEGRGAYWNRCIRILRDPIAGNHSARNKGAEIARGKYIYFSDAHMALRPGFFTSMMKTVDESGGLVHGALQFMGAYPPTDSSMGYGYSIKLGEEIKGTWNNYKVSDKWFYVPAQGHWGVMALKEQFVRFGGYPKIHRTYGGGEFYTDIKWWLFGSSVAVEPNAIGYHLASGRGYSYDHDDYIENVLGMAYALGMDDWRERAYLNWLRRGRKEVLDEIMERSDRENRKDREFVNKHRKKTFNELIVERPWDEMNMKRHGRKNSAITVFHETWLNLLNESPVAKEAYEESKYQKGLEEFINANLSQFVYKRNKTKEVLTNEPI